MSTSHNPHVLKVSKVSRLAAVLVAAIALVFAGLPAYAQGGDMPPLPGEVVIGDLGAPRGIAFDAAGNLIVAVAGTGGEVTMTLPGPEGEQAVQMGLTGRIVMVDSAGKATNWVAGFPSYAFPMETLGMYRAIPNGDSMWVVFSGTGASSTGMFWSNTIAQIDTKTLRTKRVINLTAFEEANDPDGNGYDSNVSDIAWGADGTMYITDAGGNSLLSWTEKDGLKVVAAWKDNAVPTSVEVAANGDLYVGFLGTGIAPAAGRVERWSGGALAETFGGLTGVTDILLSDGKLYAAQLFLFTDKGPGPGSVVMLADGKATPVAEGIPAPFGLAKGPDGSLYVSFGTIALAPGMTGGVLKIKQ